MTYHKFDDLIGDLTPEQRARVEALKDEARAEMVTYTLGELRRHRELTQTELARRLDRAQASVSAMETAADNLVSTLRMAVEGMGGRLEVTAVFDDERIPLTTHSRTTQQERAARTDTLMSALRAATSEAIRRVGDPRHEDEQREARRLLADLEKSLKESGSGDEHRAAGSADDDRDAKTLSEPAPARPTRAAPTPNTAPAPPPTPQTHSQQPSCSTLS
ncbi:MAG: XRE family transcriptional regulator [Acidimicrobiaceae bacterium]|nr:XRE family transcriptional regulator [Acidimicrobiaceae bacterium]